ncbi:hypothetical protein, partial [Klebsiella variicola]|uniref:hypothetical protein n=1 Tax=Klebsiella variicola TaxID=244366 RepID=UPI001D0D2FFF
PAQRAGILLPEGIPATAGIVNLRYKSCPEMAGQDHPAYKRKEKRENGLEKSNHNMVGRN